MPFSANTIGTALLGALPFSDTFAATASNDVEMVAFDLVAGTLYEFDVDGTAGDSYIRIFDRYGNEVKANDDANDDNSAEAFVFGDSYTQLLAGYTGRYYAAISNFYLTEYDPLVSTGRPSVENPGTFASGTLNVTSLGTTNFPDAASIGAASVAGGLADETDLFNDADGVVRVEYQGETSVDGADVEMGRFDLIKGDRVVVDVNGQIDAADFLNSVIRIFDDNGTQIGFDQGSGFSTDSELVFIAPNTDDFYIAISGVGNSTYNALDGTGAIVGDSGDFTVILHRNPTQVGSSFVNDSIAGDGNANYIVGLAFNDTLSGGDGEDTLAGGDDRDSLTGGNGDDQLYGEFGDDVLNGGKGGDVVSGGFGDDDMTGAEGADVMEGGAGNDTMSGGRQGDTMRGGLGNDDLSGFEGQDIIFGDDGLDTIRGGLGNDSADGGTGNDNLNGADGNDTLIGGTGLDTLVGDIGNDTLAGGTDNDRLDGGTENDALNGEAGNDTLIGGDGNDTMAGGTGNDRLTGGTGADVFFFFNAGDATDIITDFTLGTDLIDLRSVFGPGVVNAGNLSQFVQATPSGAGVNSFLGVDANGLAGGLVFTIIAELTGVTPAQLFDIDNFLL